MSKELPYAEGDMLRNIYAPLSGGMAQERMLEILANNIANTGTTGFKEDALSFKALEANPWDNYPTPLPPAHFKLDMHEIYPLHGSEMQYATVANPHTDFTQGSLRKTDNPLDLAIQGNGFFSVSTPFGERYTRDGSFSLSPEGMLMTKTGAVVQGEKGAIVGLKEGELKILPTGEVYSGTTLVDRIKVVAFADTTLLQKLGANLFVHDGPPTNQVAPSGEISQGSIESSNANPMKNLSAMIVAHRTYEALQKAVKAHDDSMGLSATKVGEVQ